VARYREQKEHADDQPAHGAHHDGDGEVAGRFQDAHMAKGDAGDAEREHGAGGIVERRLRHERLDHLRADPERQEDGDQHGGVGGRENRTDEQRGLPAEPEEDVSGRSDDRRRDQDARDGKREHRATNPPQQLQGEHHAAGEQDGADAERESDARGGIAGPDVHQPGSLRSEGDPRGEQQDDFGDPEHTRDGTDDQPCAEQNRDQRDGITQHRRAARARRARGSGSERRPPRACVPSSPFRGRRAGRRRRCPAR
jgi:hypothetical protein